MEAMSCFAVKLLKEIEFCWRKK
ncbi:hypothetical protein CPC197_1009A, partial [Chlamydia psittaci C1/97]